MRLSDNDRVAIIQAVEFFVENQRIGRYDSNNQLIGRYARLLDKIDPEWRKLYDAYSQYPENKLPY